MKLKKPTINKKEALIVFALQHTKTDQYMSLAEFQLELDRLKYIKKAFSNYENAACPNLPLFITHFVILNNIFTCDVLNKILFAEIPEKHWPLLKTVLSWLNLLVLDKTLKLPTKPPVIIRLNKINTSKQLLEDLNNAIQS